MDPLRGQVGGGCPDNDHFLFTENYDTRDISFPDLILTEQGCVNLQQKASCVQLDKFPLLSKFDKMYQQLLRCLPCKFNSNKQLNPP